MNSNALTETLEVENTTLLGKHIKIPYLDRIVDEKLYEVEQKTYETSDIGGDSSMFTASVKEVRGYEIGLDFLYKIFHFTVNEEDLGTKTDTGTLWINIFTGESSIEIESTKIKDPSKA